MFGAELGQVCVLFSSSPGWQHPGGRWGCRMHQAEALWSRCCREGDKVKTQGACQGSVTRALALRVCRKEFPQRQKVVNQVQCFLGGKIVQYLSIRHMGRFRGRVPELRPSGSLSYFYVIFPPGFLCQSFWLAWFTVHIWCTSGSSQVCVRISWPRWILPQRPMGRTSLDMTPLWPPRSLLCASAVEEVSWL